MMGQEYYYPYWDDMLELAELDSQIESNNKMIEKIKSKKRTRVTGLWGGFEKLSKIEKENFINLIRNYMTYGSKTNENR